MNYNERMKRLRLVITPAPEHCTNRSPDHRKRQVLAVIARWAQNHQSTDIGPRADL
jgi:hypothetical protein